MYNPMGWVLVRDDEDGRSGVDDGDDDGEYVACWLLVLDIDVVDGDVDADVVIAIGTMVVIAEPVLSEVVIVVVSCVDEWTMDMISVVASVDFPIVALVAAAVTDVVLMILVWMGLMNSATMTVFATKMMACQLRRLSLPIQRPCPRQHQDPHLYSLPRSTTALALAVSVAVPSFSIGAYWADSALFLQQRH